jgi:hypothetical protein
VMSNLPSPRSKMPGKLISRGMFAFWGAIVIGAALRVYCVVGTNGTGDMDDWEDHARQVHDRGLIGYYHANSFANHPPLVSELGSLMFETSVASGIPFRILFRGLFALLDAANALLLFVLLPADRRRFLLTACYWISPAAIIISSFHGNTDTAVAFFLLLSIWLARDSRTVRGGIAFGAGLWVKLPGILALPALITFFRNWRGRGAFLFAAALTALSTYLPALIQDYKIVLTNVFGYRGLILQTTGGAPLWGPSVLLFSTVAPIQVWPEKFVAPVLFVLEQSWYLAIGAMLVLIWLRRHCSDAAQVCATIAMAYIILLGFSDYWAFQYFAWSLPFWFFLSWRFWVPAVFLTSAYLYSLHALFCGNPLLQGGWDFSGHPQLPLYLSALRDVSVLFFFVTACAFLFAAARSRRTSPQTSS